jgi:hypothetical protein
MIFLETGFAERPASVIADTRNHAYLYIRVLGVT